jgi:hypothetical protein
VKLFRAIAAALTLAAWATMPWWVNANGVAAAEAALRPLTPPWTNHYVEYDMFNMHIVLAHPVAWAVGSLGYVAVALAASRWIGGERAFQMVITPVAIIVFMWFPLLINWLTVLGPAESTQRFHCPLPPGWVAAVDMKPNSPGSPWAPGPAGEHPARVAGLIALGVAAFGVLHLYLPERFRRREPTPVPLPSPRASL